MLKFFYKQKRKKGFTLVELIVIVVIIGVIAAILIPTVLHYITDSKIASANATAASIRRNIEAFMLDLNLQSKGMKRGKHINAQIMFMVDNGKWCVKTECKVNGANDTDGHLTFNDHTNWWRNNATGVLLDTTTKNDPNHQLALCSVVAGCCKDLRTGFIMAFFSDSVCKGVVYMPECNYLWPGNYGGVPSSMQAGRQKKRPALVHGRTDASPCLLEFSPWAGNWPATVDDRFWEGQEGVDKEGYIVGTAPVIKFGPCQVYK